MNNEKTTKLTQYFMTHYSYSANRAEIIAEALAESDNLIIIEAIEKILEDDGPSNVVFAGSCCTLMLEKVYGFSYPEALFIIEEMMRGLEHAALCKNEVSISKNNGLRLIFKPAVIDSRGNDITNEHIDAISREESINRMMKSLFKGIL